jgi:hypothetical protein
MRLTMDHQLVRDILERVMIQRYNMVRQAPVIGYEQIHTTCHDRLRTKNIPEEFLPSITRTYAILLGTILHRNRLIAPLSAAVTIEGYSNLIPMYADLEQDYVKHRVMEAFKQRSIDMTIKAMSAKSTIGYSIQLLMSEIVQIMANIGLTLASVSEARGEFATAMELVRKRTVLSDDLPDAVRNWGGLITLVDDHTLVMASMTAGANIHGMETLLMREALEKVSQWLNTTRRLRRVSLAEFAKYFKRYSFIMPDGITQGGAFLTCEVKDLEQPSIFAEVKAYDDYSYIIPLTQATDLIRGTWTIESTAFTDDQVANALSLLTSFTSMFTIATNLDLSMIQTLAASRARSLLWRPMGDDRWDLMYEIDAPNVRPNVNETSLTLDRTFITTDPLVSLALGLDESAKEAIPLRTTSLPALQERALVDLGDDVARNLPYMFKVDLCPTGGAKCEYAIDLKKLVRFLSWEDMLISSGLTSEVRRNANIDLIQLCLDWALAWKEHGDNFELSSMITSVGELKGHTDVGDMASVLVDQIASQLAVALVRAVDSNMPLRATVRDIIIDLAMNEDNPRMSANNLLRDVQLVDQVRLSLAMMALRVGSQVAPKRLAAIMRGLSKADVYRRLLGVSAVRPTA